MFELVLMVCMKDMPTDCKNEYLNSNAPSYRQCMMDIPSMAKYMGDHPNKVIMKWKCIKAGTEANL